MLAYNANNAAYVSFFVEQIAILKMYQIVTIVSTGT